MGGRGGRVGEREGEGGGGRGSNQGMCFTLNNGAASQAFNACENVYQLSTFG